MADYQQNRSASIAGPGDMQGLMLTRLTAVEQISRPFQFDLELSSMEGAGTRGAADPDGILGKPVCVTLRIAGSQRRYFHGVVTEFAYTGHEQGRHEYRAIVRPAFWLLTRRVDCRVLQNKSTPDIFAEICRLAGFNDHKLALSARYEPWEYRVQYRESDFDFLSRLLEHEGIYYYFEHFSDRHVLVLTDDVGKLETVSGYEKVPYYPPGGDNVQRERDHLSSWHTTKSFQPASFAAREYNFETPSSLVGGVSPVAGRSDASRFEVFEYPAGANKLTATGVERVAKVRAEQMQSSQSVVRSSGDAAGLSAGRLFTLDGYPRSDMNKRYLITATSCVLVSDSARTGAATGGEARQFSISIEAIDAREPFRPARVTPKPLIQGTQTARVVSGSGDGTTTDKYGRVKVQFHWDRAGSETNQDGSCWVRVAQSWAGKNWGTQYVPRIDQEVVVSFLDGDPDRPLIIGSVYNAEQMPPFELPANQTQSGVRSRSVKDGTAENFNEIRLEDKKDAEEIYIHAEKNLRVVVENNQTLTIGADKKDPGDRTTTIHNDDKLNVGRNLETTIAEKETRTIGKDRVTTLKANDRADVKNKYQLTAGDQITFEVGQAKIVMKSDGTIEITGMQVKIKGNSKVEIDGTQTAISGQQLDMKGTKTAVQGSGMLDLASSGIASLKGSLTKIG